MKHPTANEATTALSTSPSLPRRAFLRAATGAAAALSVSALAGAQDSHGGGHTPARQGDYVSLPPIHAPTEAPDKAPGPFTPTGERVGFAIVGLGRLSIDQILPAFAQTKYCKPVALVSGSDGSLDKARKLAAQYGIRNNAVLRYADYEKLADMPEVKVIYIVLPNSMHAEYVVRGAKAGKHILCEKPMATSVADCEHMIAACRAANVKLMIAYRQQYEPMNREIVKMAQSGKLGTLRSFIATNSQNEGTPAQWRLNRKLAGGGCLPDVGIYCLNAARFLTGEEPVEVFGQTFQPKDDPRFTEVEATCSFSMRFPSGLLATCSTGYAGHSSQFLRLEGSEAWAELSPAFSYHGLKLRTGRLVDGHEVHAEPSFPDKDQFALEMDHMAMCVTNETEPHTPGEEGLQDQRITDAIYESAKTGRAIKLIPPSKPTRGPEPS